ncbi:hypothetical protein F5144DRAFT_567504 [Chaetomium tenue]|uniref:Uncharacterized protein n=1 Tax=Chaetomium tenue TaxID=1854479 RepID=A0ACB7PC24_9PEZI|nr:hypothetical protein F5144DRAFT_567504 [Chaetomium globosum]
MIPSWAHFLSCLVFPWWLWQRQLVSSFVSAGSFLFSSVYIRLLSLFLLEICIIPFPPPSPSSLLVPPEQIRLSK